MQVTEPSLVPKGGRRRYARSLASVSIVALAALPAIATAAAGADPTGGGAAATASPSSPKSPSAPSTGMTSPPASPSPTHSPSGTPTPTASPTQKPSVPSPDPSRAGEQAGPVASIVRGQANPDECFLSIGKEILPIDNGTCPEGYRARTNQVYTWGFTVDQAQRSLWFGSATLGLCGNGVTYQSALEAAGFNRIPAFDSDEVTCEFDKSFAGQSDPSIGDNGDLRPPVVYQYDLASDKLVNRTPDDPIVGELGGFRSAGAIGDIVFLAGVKGLSSDPAAPGNVVLLAFRTSTGEYLGAQEFAQYSNPKVFFRSSDNQSLYAGFGLSKGEDPVPGQTHPVWGNVVRWTGDEADPFEFDVVGRLANQPTYMQEYAGRLVTNSWPAGPVDQQIPPTLDISPRLPAGGLTAGDANAWRTVFSTADYFPDFEKSLAAGGGGMQELDGWLYFGTASAAGLPTMYGLAKYPNAVDRSNIFEVVDFFQKSESPGHVWRLRNIGQPNQQVQVLYGDQFYWTFVPDNSTRGGHWEYKENLLHQKPRYGPAGFGNRWQYYSAWGSAKFQGKVYFGGFDSQKVAHDFMLNPQTKAFNTIFGTDLSANELDALRTVLLGEPAKFGVDAWVFADANSPAKPVTDTGFNNQDNWGARDWFNIKDQRLLVGTQGGWQYPPSADDPDQTVRRPGWQLLELFPAGTAGQSPSPTPAPTKSAAVHEGGTS